MSYKRLTKRTDSDEIVIDPLIYIGKGTVLHKAVKRLAELEDKLESGLLVDTTPYIVENKNDIPFKYKVIKPTLHRRNVEMCDSKESAEACLKKLEVGYANKT